MDSLKRWMSDLFDDFDGEDVPAPDKFDDVLSAVSRHFRSTPVQYIGSGDNGIVFVASDGDVIKFTIDEKEAILWNRLKNQSTTGIVSLKDVANLSSSEHGDSIIFVVKAEYAPYDLTAQQRSLVKQAKEAADRDTAVAHQQMPNMGVEARRKLRTTNFIAQFEKLAAADEQFAQVPRLLADLSETHGAHLFDLQPENFKRRLSGEVVIIDPSVPDLLGAQVRPDRIMYEERIRFGLDVNRIYY